MRLLPWARQGVPCPWAPPQMQAHLDETSPGADKDLLRWARPNLSLSVRGSAVQDAPHISPAPPAGHLGGGCSNKARTVTAETHLDRMRAQPLGQLGGHPHSATGHFTFHRQAGLTSAPAGDGYTSSMGNASSTRSVIDPVKENRALGASL